MSTATARPIPHILLYSPSLARRKCEPIAPASFKDGSLRALAEDMMRVMYRMNGVGLHASQIGAFCQVAVLHFVLGADGKLYESGKHLAQRGMQPGDKTVGPLCLVNAFIMSKSGETITEDERCLSLPDVVVPVPRAEKIRLWWQDIDGGAHEEELEGGVARAIQHELDHQNGTFIVDYLRPIKKDITIRNFRKFCQQQVKSGRAVEG